MTDLDRAVQTVVRRCLNIQPDEDVVVVVDEPLQDLGEKLRAAAQRSGADAVLTVMSPRPTDGSEPPAPVAEALAACDVFIAPASRSLSHTLARKRASEAGARGATMPHVTADMLARLMSIDFDRLRARSHAVAQWPRGARVRADRHVASAGMTRSPISSSASKSSMRWCWSMTPSTPAASYSRRRATKSSGVPTIHGCASAAM